MTILQKPETINLSGNLVDFILSSSSAVSFVLKEDTRVLFEGNYTPNDNQRIEIDVKDIIEADLKAVFSDSSEPYEQSELVKTYTAEIAEQTHTFTVIKAGVDRLATSAANFLKANWLTWQPQVKKVTYYLPESLTFYSVEASVVKVKAYFQQPDGGYSEETKQLLSIVAGKVYTVPVQYAVIAGKFESRLPAFYDVWFETVDGVRLSYIQRYVSSGMMSEDESWIVFENSLGGFDTFRAYGQQSLTAEHDHQLAEIGDITDEYNVDTTREFQKNTGYLADHERKWLLDFFPSRQKYLYSSNYLRRIVVTEDDTSYTGNELPSSYTFNYRFADAKPYLNLQRVEELPSDLTISIPDLSSFTIPPRLVEFPSQNLTEGVMFPVQNPYSENWATTTIGAILSYIMNKIIEVGGDGTGGVGHTHANFDVLKALEYVDEYLTYNGKKIKAGYADEAGRISEENDVYIHKDRIDATSFLLKLLGGAFFGDFVTGIQGGMIDKNGDAELRSIYARKRIFTPEMAYNRVTYIKGKYVISPGGGCTVDTVTDNGDGTYTVKPDLTDADALSQFPDDILTTYFVTRSEEGVLNGFEEMKFRVVSSDFDAKTFVITPKSGNNWVPQESMVLAQTGNFTDAERQTYIIFDTVNGNNSITFFDHANTWEPEPAQMPIWIGKKKGMTVAGINCDDYPAVLQNILMTGLIFQIDEITGDTVRVPLDKGEWEAGQYGYYNRVSHNGALWLCISEEGTSEEPGTGNAWLKQVAEGAEGKPGLSVVGGGHWEASKTPYAANTMVTLFNCVFLSNKQTSNPPIAISRFKNGNYRKKKDGGYILAGKYADFTVHPDWVMLLDGRELKGTSITFLGSFATAPSNPVEGNSYYNTTDKCTYIYRNGVWMVMVSDGKDGRDYEWIYTRNNSIGITPDKPDSQQQDDYVPEGWTDDFLGVSEEFQVEWACKRTKKDGVWSEWSDPAPIHRWSKDGENAIFADLDNEMVNCALTYDGKATKAQSWTTNVTMWYGTEATELNSLTTTQPSGFTVSADKATGRVTVSVAQGTTVAETTNIEITLVAQISGQNYERKLTFTIAGVRAGEAGADAVLYSLVTSVSSVTKDKNGSYSVASVSCTRQKTVGSTISDTTDGELKYSLDGGAEVVLQNGVGISPANFNRYIKFIFYVSGKIVDIETVPLIADGRDGAQGEPGTGLNPRGHWTADAVPFYKNDLVNFAYGTFVALRETSEPPLAISRFKNGNYRRKRDGGYILAGNSSDMTVHSDWQMMTPPDQNASYWLDSPVSSIGISSVGTPSPSSVQVTCRMSIHGSTQLCGLFYLVARKYNGSWLSHVSPVKDYDITVPATSGYTQFAVRAYRSSSDANAWNDNYVCEKGIGVSVDGAQGADAAFLYDNGPWKSGTSYVWNDTRRDKVIHPFDGVYYNFQIKAKGMTVTAAPSSATGDSNWEALGKYISICTDSLFADGANIANFMFKNGVMRSQAETDGVANMILNGNTGYFHCSNVDITGGTFSNITFATSESGDRVIIDAATNSIKMMSGNNLLGNFFFYEFGGYKSAQLYVNNGDSGEIAEFRPGQIVTTCRRIADVPHMIECEMSDSFIVRNNNTNKSVYISEEKIQFNDGETFTGWTGRFSASDENFYGIWVYVKNGIIYKAERP